MAEAKSVTIPRADFEAMIERAAEEGAKKAMHALGLHDEDAAADVRELRGLLEAWRAVKDTALRTATKTVTTLLLAGIAAALGLKLFLKD